MVLCSDRLFHGYCRGDDKGILRTKDMTKIMKRVLAILLATAAVALALGSFSSKVQNAPQQPVPPQAPPPQPAPQPAASAPSGGAPADSGAKGAPNAGNSTFLGKDVPFFDPGSNIITWDGKSWNISNNQLFEARFEKYPQRPSDNHAA